MGQADGMQARDPLSWRGLTLSPGEAVTGWGPGQPPGLIRLGVCTACLFLRLAHLLSLLQLLWKAPAYGAPGQSTGEGPAAAQVFMGKDLRPIAHHPGTQSLILFSTPALPPYPWPLSPRPTGILKHPE